MGLARSVGNGCCHIELSLAHTNISYSFFSKHKNAFPVLSMRRREDPRNHFYLSAPHDAGLVGYVKIPVRCNRRILSQPCRRENYGSVRRSEAMFHRYPYIPSQRRKAALKHSIPGEFLCNISADVLSSSLCLRSLSMLS